MPRYRSKPDIITELNQRILDVKGQVQATRSRDSSSSDWIFIGDTNAPAFQNSAVHSDPTEVTYSKAGFMKNSAGFVHLCGAVTSGPGFTTVMFTLPLGYRPRKNVRYAIPFASSSGQANIQVASNGDVSLIGTASANPAHLSGVIFRAEQ